MFKWSFRIKQESAKSVDSWKASTDQAALLKKSEAQGSRVRFRNLLRRRTTRRCAGSASAPLNENVTGSLFHTDHAQKTSKQLGLESSLVGTPRDRNISEEFRTGVPERRQSVRERLYSENKEIADLVTTEYLDLSQKMANYTYSVRPRICSEQLSARDQSIRKRFASVTQQAQEILEESSSAAMISAYLEEGFAMLDKSRDAGIPTSTPMASGRFVRPSASSMGGVSAISDFGEEDEVFLPIDLNSQYGTTDESSFRCSSSKSRLQLVLPTKTDSPDRFRSRSIIKRSLDSDLIGDIDRSADVAGGRLDDTCSAQISSPCGTFKRQRAFRTKRVHPYRRRVARETKTGNFRWTSTREIILHVMDKDRRVSTTC